MDQGELRIRKGKKGKIITEIVFANGKMMSVPPSADISDMSLNGKTVEVERVKGQIEKVVCEGNVIFSKAKKQSQPPKPKKYEHAGRSHGSHQSIYRAENTGETITDHLDEVRHPATAKAPYNFIPLNDKVVEAESIPDFDTYHYKDHHTGHIDLEIETITPLYIRDTLNTEEMERQEKEENFINSDFFSPKGLSQIPGSSVRGMVRTLVEITSYGKFGAFDDKNLYFRGLADKSNLRREYQSKMSSFDRRQKRTQYKMNAGFIYKDGLKYFIKAGATFGQILKRHAQEKVQATGQNYEEFKAYNLGTEYIVVSGNMPNKKKDWVIYPSDSNERIEILEADIKAYKNDTNRSDEVPDLTAKAKNGDYPCFYVKWTDSEGKDRISFGHTAMFRLAYALSVKDHIPKHLLEKDGFDIPEAIFGNENLFAGRVFFEDALLTPGQENITRKEDITRILASPKPTTFQHYLVQDSDAISDLNHYNSPNAAIRGNKVYWHKSGENWQETDRDKMQNKKIITKIQPVRPGVKFQGRIRFENLSHAELGALLFSLDLPGGCNHKLGMGKPLGLGSVKITPRLFLSDRKKRYENLSFEWNNEIDESDRIPEFTTAFEQYVLNRIEPGEKMLWNTERLRELKIMLDYDKGKKSELQGKVRYMEITGRNKNEFKDRPILPKPSNVRCYAYV